ncbi:MAG: hypothetical protein M3Q29_13930 [Chloroflexota bacterium]|nr:hypothetical protein [Chloroflexota bacterium]
MSHEDSIDIRQACNKGTLYLAASGHLYHTPLDRAKLEQALRFQRRVSSHLTNIILYLAAARRREVQG